jgi:dihydrofolate synthase/folylpolyglutamate synthase
LYICGEIKEDKMEKRKMEFNTAVLLDKQFNHPHTSYPVIHVAGTDGKGSTSSMIASILIEAGYKVGTFNTPGIHGRRSTIRINGEVIQKNKIKRIIRKINTVAKKNNIPIIRWVNIYAEAAFLYFKNEHVDIAVVEVCKGGQTDPTNVVNPIISVLTNITPDHLDVFNNDFMTYANEKVGVIKNMSLYMLV